MSMVDRCTECSAPLGYANPRFLCAKCDEALVSDARVMAETARKSKWLDRPLYAETLEALADRVARYREALEPFADAADTWDAAQPTDGHPDIRVADLYAARAALSQHTDGGNNNGSK
jgi:hypothetical protein